MKPFFIGLPGKMLGKPSQDGVSGQFCSFVADSYAKLPAALDQGASSRPTQRPEIEVSGIAARHSRVTSLTTLSTRKR